MGTIEEDELKPMQIRIRSDPTQDSHEREIIPSGRLIGVYDFFVSTNGSILILIMVCVVLFIQYANNNHGAILNRFFQYNAIINSNPNHLRDMIREASIAATQSKALKTVPVNRYELIDDKGLQFVISVAGSYANTIRGKVATLPGASEDDTPRPIEDPLDPTAVHDDLLVLNYQEEFNRPYSILLNKFNTIPDHCLLVTNDFYPQITPLSGSDLSLLYSILYQTSAVGFYNSNVMAGASQKHKHMQFIPMDETWKHRDVDAQYGIPINDIIMPNIEVGSWQPMHCYEHRLAKKYRDDVYHIPHFDFQHGIAVLKVSGEFLTVEDHAAYLQCVYETLLTINEIPVSSLETCAAEAAAELAGEGEDSRRLRGAERSLKSDEPTFADVLVEDKTVVVDCQKDVAYNLVMTADYMMVVPRGSKAHLDTITVNSFGFLGFMLASSEQKLDLLRSETPLHVLKGVTVPKKYKGYHDHHHYSRL